MSSYGEWRVDDGRNAIDPQNYHAWRARWNGSAWEYERKCMSREEFSQPQDLVSHLAAQSAKQAHLALLAQQLQQTHLGTNNPFAKSSRAGGSSGASKGKGKATARSRTPPAGSNYSGQASAAITQAQYAYQLGRGGAATTLPGQYMQRGGGVATNSGLRLDGYKAVRSHKKRDFFKFGRVFKTPITESALNPLTGKDEIFSEILRMVIVRPHGRHSLCVAVHSYNGRATIGKRAQDHVIIFVGDKAPAPLAEEDPAILNHSPIRVRLEPPEDKMPNWKSTSRLNLAKLYTIDHSVIVRNVGTISRRNAFRLRNWCLEMQGLLPGGGMSKQLAIPEDELEEEDED